MPVVSTILSEKSLEITSNVIVGALSTIKPYAPPMIAVSAFVLLSRFVFWCCGVGRAGMSFRSMRNTITESQNRRIDRSSHAVGLVRRRDHWTVLRSAIRERLRHILEGDRYRPGYTFDRSCKLDLVCVLHRLHSTQRLIRYFRCRG